MTTTSTNDRADAGILPKSLRGLKKFDPDGSMPGDRYIDARTGDVWRVIGWIVDPAAILENTRTHERHVEVIGCQNDKERWIYTRQEATP